MKNIVRKGDTLRPFGGVVLEGHYECMGLPMACVGDTVCCNKHAMTCIDEGSSLSEIDGRPIALDGHRCACGCTLVSSLPDMLIES